MDEGKSVPGRRNGIGRGEPGDGRGFLKAAGKARKQWMMGLEGSGGR